MSKLSPLLSALCEIVATQNWMFVLILVPVSLSYDMLDYMFKLIDRLYGLLTDIDHEARLKQIQEQLSVWRKLPERQLMCTARPSWKSISFQPMAYKNRMHKIKIDLPNILSIDENQQRVRVEPMVTIGELNDYLIKKGWMLPVVPELDDLTIGGLVMGGGIETTSHKYGLFNATCTGYEIVMPDGSILWCDKDHNQKLFISIPFSYGTLGFLTAVDIVIVPYRPYLQHTYIPVCSVEDAVDVFKREIDNPSSDTVEGIMFSRHEGVIMSGKFVENTKEEKYPINNVGKWHKVYFYKHVEKIAKLKTIQTEYIPTWDYFHRHNKGVFWMANYIEHSTQHPLFRYLLGWTRPSKFSLLKGVRNSIFKKAWDPVLQDYMVKLEDLSEFINYAHENIECYPLWLCPVRHTIDVYPDEVRELVKDDLTTSIIVDVGIYGAANAPNYKKEVAQRKMERWCVEHAGYVALYAETFLTKTEFTKMFYVQLKYYDELRKKYGLYEAFPESYDKISSAAREDDK